MESRPFGNTGLSVSALGFGAGHLARVAPGEVAGLLNGVLDLGVTLVDTARGYGPSEELIGRHLTGRRQEFTLVTKVGYGVEGCVDWTREAVVRGIDRALRLLGTERIDVCLLHSCDLATLQRGEVIEGLQSAVSAGKVLVPGYSGENAELRWAIESGHFGAIETSVNLCDQWSLHHALPAAASAGIGVIAKRPLANVAWTFAERPAGEYAEDYWLRLREMGLEPENGDWLDTAARFSAHAAGVASAIVGTSRLEHLRLLAALVDEGPLAEPSRQRWISGWQAHDSSWPGLV